MKTEINLENKAKFFAQYWGQPVCTDPEMEQIPVNGKILIHDLLMDAYLGLKPISSIADKDLIDCYHMHSALIGYDYTMDFLDTLTIAKKWMRHEKYETVIKYRELADFLRSRGYALPWMGLSVEEMIEVGWIKLF